MSEDDSKNIGYIRLCGVPIAGTVVGVNGTAEYIKKKGKWVKI